VAQRFRARNSIGRMLFAGLPGPLPAGRIWLSPASAALALAIFAANPNLLYLQTTAMTEPLFLCE